ncbi:hypothetical protein PYCC9005_005362 [Savitreella phatthalungensis]
MNFDAADINAAYTLLTFSKGDTPRQINETELVIPIPTDDLDVEIPVPSPIVDDREVSPCTPNSSRATKKRPAPNSADDAHEIQVPGQVPARKRRRPAGRRNGSNSSAESVAGPRPTRNSNPPLPVINKNAKSSQTAAQASKTLCAYIKHLRDGCVPDMAPPRDAINGSIFFTASDDPSMPKNFKPELSEGIEIDPISPLSAQEQRFCAAWTGGMSHERYTLGKLRIFTAHRWRTEEDGLFHNIESSQRVCPFDVKVASVLHKWYDSMKLFDQPWKLENTPVRPIGAVRVPSDTCPQGRNGRNSRNPIEFTPTTTSLSVLSKFDPWGSPSQDLRGRASPEPSEES